MTFAKICKLEKKPFDHLDIISNLFKSVIGRDKFTSARGGFKVWENGKKSLQNKSYELPQTAVLKLLNKITEAEVVHCFWMEFTEQSMGFSLSSKGRRKRSSLISLK